MRLCGGDVVKRYHISDEVWGYIEINTKNKLLELGYNTDTEGLYILNPEIADEMDVIILMFHRANKRPEQRDRYYHLLQLSIRWINAKILEEYRPKYETISLRKLKKKPTGE